MATDQNAPNPNPDQNTKTEKTDSAPVGHTTPQPAPQPSTEQKQQPQQNRGQNRSRYRGRGRGWNRDRDRDALYDKAVKLAQSGRVEFLDNGIYNVIGDHGTYTVAIDHTGKLSCNCPGFIQKGVCSHVTAVSLVTKHRHRR